tara:strand:+ start:786 stop:3737 length:2952 start_codon:yes stop_codon:yes gene_type:complete
MPQRPVLSGGQRGGRLLGGAKAFDRVRSSRVGQVDQTAEIEAAGQAKVGQVVGDLGKDLFNFAINQNERNKQAAKNEEVANQRLLASYMNAQLSTVDMQAEAAAKAGTEFDLGQAYQEVRDGLYQAPFVAGNPAMVEAYGKMVQDSQPLMDERIKQRSFVNESLFKSAKKKELLVSTETLIEDAMANASVENTLDLMDTYAAYLQTEDVSVTDQKKGQAFLRQKASESLKFESQRSQAAIQAQIESAFMSGEFVDEKIFKQLARQLYQSEGSRLIQTVAGSEEAHGLGYHLGSAHAKVVVQNIENNYLSITDAEAAKLYRQYDETRTAKVLNINKDLETQYERNMQDASGSLAEVSEGLNQYLNYSAQATAGGAIGETTKSFNTRVTAAKQVVNLFYGKLSNMVNTVYTGDPEQTVFRSKEWKSLNKEIATLKSKIRQPDETARLAGLEDAKGLLTNYVMQTSAYDVASDAAQNDPFVDATKEGVSANHVAFSQGDALKLPRSLKANAGALLKNLPRMDAPTAFQAAVKMSGAIGEHYKEHEATGIPQSAFFGDMYNNMFQTAGDAYTPEQKMLLSTAFNYASAGDENSFSKLFTAAKGAMGAKLVAGTRASEIADKVAIEHLSDDRSATIRGAFAQNNPFGGAMEARNAELFLSRVALGLAEADGHRLTIEDDSLVDLNVNKPFMDEMDDYMQEAQRLMLNGKEPITTGRSNVVVNVPKDYNPKQVADTVAFFEKNFKREAFREQAGFMDDQFPENQSWENAQVSNSKDGSGIIVTFPSGTGAQQPIGYYQGLNTKVLSVSDGDTMTVDIKDNSVSIRLKDIDTFEKSQEGGLEATEALKSLVGESGGDVRLIFSSVDKYGRPVATVKGKDGENLNLTMVREGNAVAFMTNNEEIIGAHNKNLSDGVYDGMVPPFAYKQDKTSKQAITEALSQNYPTIKNRIYIPMEKLMKDYGSSQKKVEATRKAKPFLDVMNDLWNPFSQ